MCRIRVSACLKSLPRQSSAATDRFRIRHLPFSLTAGTRLMPNPVIARGEIEGLRRVETGPSPRGSQETRLCASGLPVRDHGTGNLDPLRIRIKETPAGRAGVSNRNFWGSIRSQVEYAITIGTCQRFCVIVPTRQ